MALRKTLKTLAIDGDNLYHCLDKKFNIPQNDATKLLDNAFVDCTDDFSEFPTYYNSEGWTQNEFLLAFIDYGYLVENNSTSEYFENIDDAIKFYNQSKGE